MLAEMPSSPCWIIVSSPCLVSGCKVLEQHIGTHKMESISEQSVDFSITALKAHFKKVDREITWNRCSEKTNLIAEVEKTVVANDRMHL